MNAAPERRKELEPPVGVSPKLALVIVETQVIVSRLRTLCDLERRKGNLHGRAIGPAGTPESQTRSRE